MLGTVAKVSLLTCFATLATVGIYRVALAAQNKCCEGQVYVDTPSPPADSDGDCLGGDESECELNYGGNNGNGKCTGTAYESLYGGQCKESEGEDCTPDYETVTKDVKKGSWGCVWANMDCGCEFTLLDPAQTTTASRDQCSGDGC